ncbi:short-chain dehydrogenase [Flavisolibacter nicotianae]|uniref:short-chain dehydrogenase n=1 Tax=Flavisolibacter nicotianae TaxID=2364882 RepID=UPI000EB1B7F9|nr:short-chain dehydrogenase [Flavisolibacter nicotianae]
MTVEQIQQFLDRETVPQGKIIRFEMKKRNPVRGLIVKGKDYNELKEKNFWRIVTQTHLVEYSKTQNINLAKIFSGTDFAKLSLVSNKAED